MMKSALHLILYIACLASSRPPVCSSFALAPPNPAVRPSLLPLHVHGDETRGEFLRRGAVGAGALAAPLILPPNPALAAETPAEAVRLLSAKSIPGLGPPDVYYPPYFAGRWRVARVVTNSDDPAWDGIELPATIYTEMRFVPYDAGKDFAGEDNPNGVPAVADRSFNEKSYRAALSKAVVAARSAPPIQSLAWTATNPNVLSSTYADGSSREVKVTKRSSDVSGNGDALFSSEFRRITDVPASSGSVAGGIPRVYKSRLLTKWRKAGGDGDRIEGIEILYNEAGTFGERADPILGGGNGPMSTLYGGDTKDMSDWRSTKTKILMERIVG